MDIPMIRTHVNFTLDQALLIQSGAYNPTPDEYQTIIAQVKHSCELLASLEAELKRS